jgi:hypothetical protein
VAVRSPERTRSTYEEQVVPDDHSFERLEHLYHTALQQPPHNRTAFLGDACGPGRW